MKEEELIKKLESVKLPDIELESHKSRLRMALLKSGYFKKRQEVTFMEQVKKQTRDLSGRFWGRFFAGRPAWQIAMAGVLLVMVIITSIVALPAAFPGLQQATPVPIETTPAITVVDGKPLTEGEKEKALDILRADAGAQALLDKGAIIENILPVSAYLERINTETGETEEVTETWAQVWLNLGGKQWGALVDLVRGKVVSLTD